MRTCPTCQRSYPDENDFCLRDGTPLPVAATATQAELEANLGRRFRIVRRLGAGGMGVVFLAEQVAVGNRPVALKVLQRKLLDDPEFLLRFRNEAASTGRIHHANVVTIYESGQADDGSPYIAMEYLEGETLRQARRARGALPASECAEILQQVARGLNAAHKLGIIHRDLKPDNIFMTRGDEGELVVKLVDFGLAKLRESATHTITGTVLGTPAYMSFEQAKGLRSEELDARSDIYSLGVVAYEMLTGRVPFHSDTPIGYISKHLSEDPPPFRAVKPDLPALPQLERVVMRALVKDREARYASALDFAREFAEASYAPQAGATEARAAYAAQSGAADARAARAPAPAQTKGVVGERSALPREGQALRDVDAVVQPPPPRPVPPPKFPGPAKTSSAKKLVLATVVILALGGGALWYFLPHGGAGTNPPPIVPPKPALSTGMLSVPGGTLMVGRDRAPDPEETPAHSVNVAPFYLDRTPVTAAQYAAFASTGVPSGQESWPATGVSWDEAQAYCQSKGERLPTEAEWEYAARGTDGRLYPWGNNFAANLTNSVESGLGHPEPVGSHRDAASPFGVLDMSGNVWQWCADDYAQYPGRRATFKIPPDAKVIRGGSYKFPQGQVTATTRNLDHRSSRSQLIGFRCAKSAAP